MPIMLILIKIKSVTVHAFFNKNNFIRTRASDFVKIKNNFRTIEPRTTGKLRTTLFYTI